MTDTARILVVDDHAEMAHLLRDELTDAGHTVHTAHAGAEAVAALRSHPFDVVLCDLRMEEVDGFDVLAAARSVDPTLPVVIMTAFGSIDTAIEAIKRGAWHYLTKPFRLEEVRLQVARALETRRLREENRALRRAAAGAPGLDGMVGRSRPMQALFALIGRVAHASAPALIQGESGTGKELVARALHTQGPRREGPFVAVNCTALPASLLESELFGHVKGSFTGATSPRRGLFVEADGGTLFLDEIGDMAPELQARLLRVLEDGQVRAVGADTPRKVDVRVVAATHQPLEERVREGRFRQDLYYRLNVVPLRLPPLRERREDIPLLVEAFLAQARRRNPHSRVTRVSPQVLSTLCAWPWPGNVRELENVVERLVVVAPGEEVDHALLELHAPAVSPGVHPLAAAQSALLPLRQLEADYIAWVVARCGGNKTRAAELLGIDVSTIHRRERERAEGNLRG